METPITLFTGHIIPSLGTIVAIGPIQRQVNGLKNHNDCGIDRRLTLTIYLREGTRLEYTAFEQQLLRDSSHDLQRWEMAIAKLEEDKQRLVEAWSQVLAEGFALASTLPKSYPVGEK